MGKHACFSASTHNAWLTQQQLVKEMNSVCVYVCVTHSFSKIARHMFTSTVLSYWAVIPCVCC